MVIYVQLSFVFFTLHKRSQENKQCQGSQLGVWVRGYEDHKLAGICCHRLPRWRKDRLLIVLCCLSLLQPTSQPFDFSKIGEVQGETTETVNTTRRERGQKEGSSDLVQSSGDVVYLTSDASSCKIKLYVLQQDVTTATKKARAMCFDSRCVQSVNFHRRGGKGNQKRIYAVL